MIARAWGAMGSGHLLPLAFLVPATPWAGAMAGMAALVGLYLFEWVFVRAPQEIPNS